MAENKRQLAPLHPPYAIPSILTITKKIKVLYNHV